VKEFAALANSSLTAFNEKFKKLTGMPPSKWLTGQKAQNVYHDIRSGRKSLKEISYEYQFSSVSHLGSFCKKNFGTSPKKLKFDIDSGMDYRN
jgi:AraC-like DNA-binding protein